MLLIQATFGSSAGSGASRSTLPLTDLKGVGANTMVVFAHETVDTLNKDRHVSTETLERRSRYSKCAEIPFIAGGLGVLGQMTLLALRRIVDLKCVVGHRQNYYTYIRQCTYNCGDGFYSLILAAQGHSSLRGRICIGEVCSESVRAHIPKEALHVLEMSLRQRHWVMFSLLSRKSICSAALRAGVMSKFLKLVQLFAVFLQPSTGIANKETAVITARMREYMGVRTKRVLLGINRPLCIELRATKVPR
jgi:hypothetical protein